jgi:Protein of unknown function (DUF1559)
MVRDLEDDLYAVTAQSAPSSRRWQMSVRDLMKLIVGLAFCFWLLSVFVHRESPAERSRWAQCRNNLKQIALALHDYHQAYGSLPPAHIADSNGRPMHSWRVLLLPFLEQQALYDQYDFREPWDGPNNVKLLSQMPGCYVCPSSPPLYRKRTTYTVITGPGTMFPGTAPVKFADVTDELSATLMVVETANVNIPWTAPWDLDVGTMSFKVNDEKVPGLSSRHHRAVSVAFADGSVRDLPAGINGKTLRALVTTAGREEMKAEDALDPP